jgi:ComF family protein
MWTFPSVVARALLVVAPPECAACDAPLVEDRLFCAECEPGDALVRDRLERGLSVVATARYEGSVAAAVRRYKYGNRPDLARLLGERLAAALRGAAFAADAVLVPVPLHVRRLAERGFNQSALLARHAGQRVGLGVLPRALVRIRETDEQAALAGSERASNVKSAFVARSGVVPRGARVILVDDVVTTGATALACVRALETAGARVLGVAAVARADRSPSP